MRIKKRAHYNDSLEITLKDIIKLLLGFTVRVAGLDVKFKLTKGDS